MANQSLFQHAAGGTPAQLQLALRSLTDKLNQALVRQQEQTSTGLADAQAQLDALLAQLDLAQTSITAILAALDDIEANGGLTDQQEFLLMLTHEVDGILGSVSQQVRDTITRSQEAANAVIKAMLDGRKNTVAIKVEQTARLTDQEAFVQQLSTFSAQIGLSLGMVNQEIVARADGDSANASAIQTVSTALDGNIAQVQVIQSSVNGLNTKFGVALNNNGEVIGLIQLDGTPSGSTFTVLADTFYVGKTGTGGGTPIPIFAIRTVNGSSQIALRADMYADGDIIARHIAAGSVTAAKINVTSLDAIAVNAGTITAGKLQRSDATMIVDLDNKRLKISN
jgi:hypothetical protein